MAEAMSNSKSSENQKVICCIFHNQEQCQLYCKDCKDLVCFECLQDKHIKHNVCRIRDSENDVRMFLQSELLEKEEMGKLNGQIDSAVNELNGRKAVVINEIGKEEDRMKKQIDLSKEKLLVNLSSTFDKYVSGITVKERFESLKQKITEENIREWDFLKLLKLLVELWDILETASAISQFAQSVKIKKTAYEFSVGKIVSSTQNTAEKFEDSIQAKRFTSTSTQTEIIKETEDDEWFDADDKVCEEDAIEYSSDIETHYPMLIGINEDVRRIEKIIPLSERDAWILADRTLRFIKECIFEEKVYATDIDDIAVLRNGNVLLLCRTQSFIMQLLPNDTVVRFANANCNSAMPRCICVTQNEEVIVVCSSEPSTRYKRVHGLNMRYTAYDLYIIKMSGDGVMINENHSEKEKNGSPCKVIDFRSHVCIIYQDICNTNLHFLQLLSVSSRKELSQYCGAVGYCPSSEFECYGICSDHNNHLLLSDFRHHCVCALDKDMKYKKCVVTSTNGLHDPLAVALWENNLWIGDKKYIFIFNYDSKESSLYA